MLLITYENDKKMHIINDAASAKYYIRKFKLDKAVDGTDDKWGWDKVPQLCVTSLKIEDADNVKQNSIEDRKFVEKTLGGKGSCFVLIGQTGIGKSSLGNSMLGFDVDDGPFQTSDSSHSCTKRILQYSGSYQYCDAQCAFSTR